jgi:hypothetical protein
MCCTAESIAELQRDLGQIRDALNMVPQLTGLHRAAALARIRTKFCDVDRKMARLDERLHQDLSPAERFRDLMESNNT